MIDKKAAALELMRRRKARSSLHDFIRFINPEYIVSDFSKTVCAELDQFIEDMINGLRPVLLLGAPPQHGKSDIVSRYLPAYFFGHHPDKRVAGLSYAKDLASDMNRDVQRIMMSPEYHQLFPKSSLNAKLAVFASVEAKRNSETFEIVGNKGSYVSQGVGGPLTGKKVDFGIIDDPIKNSKEALSAVVKEGLWNWYTSTFLTRLSKNSGQIIMATRWATDDLTGMVAKKNTRARSLAFKAISDDGKALVPELHPIEKLLETKAVLSDYFWEAMYQQEPIVMGGNLFKMDWWQYYTKLPAIRRKAIFGDTALKAGEANDYSVLQCWGEGYDGNLYLIDQIRGKWEAPELEVNVKAFYNKHKDRDGCYCSAVYIEDKASGIGLIQSLQRKGGIPIVGIPRDTDKVLRSQSASPSIKAGMVYLPEDWEGLSDYQVEFSQFPRGKNDDQIDPTMDAIAEFLGSNVFTDYGSLL